MAYEIDDELRRRLNNMRRGASTSAILGEGPTKERLARSTQTSVDRVSTPAKSQAFGNLKRGGGLDDDLTRRLDALRRGDRPSSTSGTGPERTVRKAPVVKTAPMGLGELQAEKRWVAGELEKGRQRREAVKGQPASAQKAPTGLAAIKELDRGLQAQRDYGVYKSTGETPADPGQIRGMQRLAEKELEEAREKERKAGAAYQAVTGPASTYLTGGGQGRAGLEPAPTEYGGRGEPAVTGRKELGELLAAQRERAEAKGRTLDLPEVYGAAVERKWWDSLPTDLREIEAKQEEVKKRRDQAQAEMTRLGEQIAELGANPTLAPEGAALSEAFQRAKADYLKADKQYNDLSQHQYDQRNVQAFGRMSGDENMVEVFASGREIQDDMDRLLAFMANSRRGGADTPTARQFVDRVKEKYGLVASGQGELQQVYSQLSERLKTASGQMAKEGYDLRDMAVYAERGEKARAQGERNEQTAQFAEEHPFAASVASAVVAPIQFFDIGQMDWGHGKPGDPDYIPPDTSAMGIVSYVNTVRGTVGRKIETQTDAELFGRNVGSFLYQTGMSMVDSGLSIATLGPGSIYLMGANAAVNTSKEIVDRGGTSFQAFWGGLAAGAAEMLFEKVSVERLLTPKSVTDWKGMVRELLTQGGVEASEEVCTEIANILSDTAIMGANSNFANAVRDYQAQGMTAEQAKQRAYLDQLAQVAEAGAGGFISGFFMDAGKVAVDYAGSRTAYEGTRGSLPQSALLTAPSSEGASGEEWGRSVGVVTPYEEGSGSGQEPGGFGTRPYEGQGMRAGLKPAPTQAQKNASTGEAAVGLVPISKNERRQLSTGKRNFVADTVKDIVSFARSALAKKGGQERLYMGVIPDSTAKLVRERTGVDVTGYKAILTGDAVQHTWRHHGDPMREQARGQRAVTAEDYGLLGEVLAEPDSVRMDDGTDSLGRPIMIFSKQIGDVSVTAQAVTDGRHALTTNSLWVQKKKGHQDTTPDAGTYDADPVLNVQNAPPEGPSIDSIPKTALDVNPEGGDGGAEPRGVGAELGGFISGFFMDAGKVAVDHAGQRAGRVSGPYEEQGPGGFGTRPYEGQQKTASVGEAGSTAVNTDPATHTPEQQAIIEAYQSNVDETLKEVFRSYMQEPGRGFSRHNISSVSQRQAEDAGRLLGGTYTGYRNAINSNAIRHILGEHGPDGTVDHSLGDLNDIARMGFVLDNYDDVEVVSYESGDADYSREFRDKNDRPAPMLRFSKRVDGTYYVIEAVPEAKYKKFWVVSAYMEKAGGGTQAPDASGPRTTSNTSLASLPSASINSISQTTQSVKNQARLAREAEVLRGIPLTKSLGEAGRTGLTHAIETRLNQGTFTEELNPLTLAEGYQEVYLAGLNGVELEPGGVPLMAGPNAELLSPTERMQAYSNGVNDTKARVELNKRRAKFATVAGTEKGLVWDDWVEHQVDAQVADRMNETAKRLGVRVAFEDSLAGGLANGQIVEADIRIAKDADQPWMVVFGHEVGHWLEKTAPGAYQTLRKFTSQRRMTEIEARIQEYQAAGRELSFDDALREYANDDIGRMIADPQILQSFIETNKNDRNLLQRLADAFRALWQRLTGKDRQQVKTAEEALLAALKASEAQAAKLERAGQVMDFGKEQSEGVEASARYSVKTVGEKKVVWISEGGLTNKELNNHAAVADYIAQHIGEVYTIIESGQSVYIGDDLPGEYTQSRYTSYLRSSDRGAARAKNKAVGGLGELIETATHRRWEKTKHPKNKDAKYGMYRYDGTFAFPIRDNKGHVVKVRAYDVELLIRNAADGKKYLYDIVNIRENTTAQIDLMKKEARSAAHSAATGDDVFTPSMPQESGDVNGNLSLKGGAVLSQEAARLEEQGRQEGWSRERMQDEIRAAVSQVLQDLAKEYGTIKPGENPVREVAVPRKTAKNEKVSQTVRTILEAGATPETAIPNIEELTAKGEFSYQALSDKAAIERAEKSIEHLGWGTSLGEWFKTVDGGGVSKDNTAMGWALYNHAVNSGDIQTAMDVLQRMVRHQRNAAQAVQATRILKQLSPETQLYGVQRSVAGLQEELNRRFGDGKAPKLVISQELAERLMEAQDQEERDVALRDIYRDIGRQMPATFLDKWNAWRYLSMLGNPRTHVRNIVGNAGFTPVVLAKDMTATAIERAVYAVSGGKLERSKGLVGLGKQGRGLLAAAWGDYVHVKDAALGGGKYSEFQNANKYIEEGRTVFTSKPGRALEAARKANSAALDAEDAWFSQPHYAYAMAQYCAAHGITEDVIRAGDGTALGKAREYAIREAQKATYRDTNALSQLLGGLGSDLRRSKNAVSRAAGVAVEGILPFRKTPANILARGLEYSPLGLVKSLSYDLAQVRRGNMTGAEAIDNISAGLTGTGLLALGVYLAAQGLLRGRGSGDDKEKELEKLQGHQDYALELGDVSVTLDWLAPEALPLFIGANLWETLQRDGDVTMSGVLEAVSNVSDPLLEMSCLQSLNDVFDSVGYASENELNPLMAALVSSATSYLTQGLPTIFGQAERVAETQRETTYTSKDAFLTGDMQYFLGKVMNKLPGEFQQIPFVDAWGRTEETGSLGERAFGNFLNPAYVSEIEESSMEKELVRLYEATGENVFPGRAKKYVQVNGQRKDLTAEEYVDYATRKGRTARKMVTALTRAKGYAGLKDGEKAEAVADTYKYAEQVARKTVVKDYAPDSWVTKAQVAEKEYGIPVETYILLRNRTAGLESIKGKDGESIANSKGLQIMEVVYDNTPGMGDRERGYLFEALGAGKGIRHYNKAKVKEELKRMRKK